METKLEVPILPQPNDTTCGPTCLHAIYRFYGEEISLDEVISEVDCLEEGGTLAVLLGCHALARGYHARIYTYNLHLFDPTWFVQRKPQLREHLLAQQKHASSQKMVRAIDAYIHFLDQGGQIRLEDLTTSLIRRSLNRGHPILTGLSATFLHRSQRETIPSGTPDALRGHPVGHFVVLCGYDRARREVLVADPLASNPLSGTNQYLISIDRVLCSVLLGISTHDANLLIIQPKRKRKATRHADPHRS